MSGDVQGEVERHLGDLAANSRVIAHAFRHRMFAPGDCPAASVLGMSRLRNARTLQPVDEHRLALNAKLRDYLGEALKRHSLFRQFPDLRADSERLHALFESYRIAHNGGDDVGMDESQQTFQDVCIQIQQSISNALMETRTLAANSFGNVRSLADKRRQNAHYLRMSSDLLAALRDLGEHPIRAELMQSESFEPLRDAFEVNIQRNLGRWLADLDGIIATLGRYAHRFRSVAHDARVIQRLNLFFRKNAGHAVFIPDAQMMTGDAGLAGAFRHARPLPLAGFALPGRPDASERERELLRAVVGKLDLGPARAKVRREVVSGRMLTPEEVAQEVSAAAGVPDEGGENAARLRYRRARAAILAQARSSPEPVSAARWVFDHPDCGLSLQLLLEMLALDSAKAWVFEQQGLRVELVFHEPEHALQGNRYFHDVRVSRAAGA